MKKSMSIFVMFIAIAVLSGCSSTTNVTPDEKLDMVIGGLEIASKVEAIKADGKLTKDEKLNLVIDVLDLLLQAKTGGVVSADRLAMIAEGVELVADLRARSSGAENITDSEKLLMISDGLKMIRQLRTGNEVSNSVAAKQET